MTDSYYGRHTQTPNLLSLSEERSEREEDIRIFSSKRNIFLDKMRPLCIVNPDVKNWNMEPTLKEIGPVILQN